MQMTIIYCFLLVSSVVSLQLDIRYPQFFHQSARDSAVEITEGKVSGSFIAFINLINETNLTLNEWLLNTTHPDFKIQSNGISYVLINTQTLDHEREDLYDFAIIAQQLVPPFAKASRDIRIRILDINDCTPTFNQSTYQTSLVPNESAFTVTAVDGDEPNTDNSRITYSLSNYQDLFRINEITGLIECVKNLKTDERYEVIVMARDHGKPSLSSTALVQIHLTPSKSTKGRSTSWFRIEQTPQNTFILASILASCLVFLSLLICSICCIHYKLKRRRQDDTLAEKKFSSSTSINSHNEFQQASMYDAINIFPNTYYLPVKQPGEFLENINNSNNNEPSLQLPHSSSTTSSPISGNDLGVKVGSDDGCYCSSDMSSEQSNNLLLLNPSSLTLSSFKMSSKQVRFNEKKSNIDGVLKRFEDLYESQANGDPCASYV